MRTLSRLLHGRGAHVPVHHILEAIPLELAGKRPNGLPHSIYEELWHIDFWQHLLLQRARGEDPRAPETASGSWPQSEGPSGAEEWSGLIGRLRQGLDEAERVAGDRGAAEGPSGDHGSSREVLEGLLAHNAYHFGRVVALRQTLGIWPPPSGGDAW